VITSDRSAMKFDTPAVASLQPDELRLVSRYNLFCFE